MLVIANLDMEKDHFGGLAGFITQFCVTQGGHIDQVSNACNLTSQDNNTKKKVKLLAVCKE